MNRFSFFIGALVLLVAEVSPAQTSSTVSVESQSDLPGVVAGRPTLKQRSPRQGTAMINGSRAGQMLVDKDEPQVGPTADSLTRQKPINVIFEGLHAFSEKDMVKAFRERGIWLPKTPQPSSEVVGKGVALIKELLESRGYFQTRLDTRYDKESETTVFLVYEGPRQALAEVKFEGNRIFSSHELRSEMEMYLTRFAKMKEGYDSNIFDYCARNLLSFIRNRGYLQATFGEPAKSIEGRGLVLTIPVKEGVLYRLGEIKFEGAVAVAPEKVRAMLNLRQGDIASGEDIGKWLFEDVKKTYGEIGYIEYTAEPEPEFKAIKGATEGVVDFKVTVEEGQQFRVHAIKFQGSNLPERELLGLLRIRAGEVFNQRLFEESIDELNKLGRFELIDKDRDADFRTDEEEALIDIVIKVKNKTEKASYWSPR